RRVRRSAAGFQRRSPCSAPRGFRSWTISLKRTEEDGSSVSRMLSAGLLYQNRARENEKTRPKAAFSGSHKRLVLALVDDLVGGDPRHHGAQLFTDHFDAMGGIVAAIGSHRRVVGGAFGDEHLGVFAVLDALQGVAHGGAGLFVDDFRTGDVFTVLGVVGDRVVH